MTRRGVGVLGSVFLILGLALLVSGCPRKLRSLHSTCSASDECESGLCVDSVCGVACSANSECPDGYCAKDKGVCKPRVCSQGRCVEDGFEACLPDGSAYEGRVSCKITDPCSTWGCSAASGCVTFGRSNGSTCDDGNACSLGDTCQSGSCVAGATVNCDDANACTLDACEPLTGACTHGTATGASGCAAGQVCHDGACCEPWCWGKACGDDGCGTPCGACEDGLTCGVNQQCAPAGLVHVADGWFTMGCTAQSPLPEPCDANESPAHQVWLGAYFIDAHEVTVARYKACVDSGTCAAPVGMGGPNGCLADLVSAPNEPVNCVTWDQADAFCTWDNGRLPTEAEWERAARGPYARIWPWGSDLPSCALANGTFGTTPCFGKPAATGTYTKGISKDGLYDMAGNVWEWVADRYAADTYAKAPKTGAVNPTGPATGETRILRGGSYGTGPWHARTTTRQPQAPSDTHGGVGFRCVRVVL